MAKIELVVFDMSGTTVEDRNEVPNCFLQAAQQSGIRTTLKHINTMRGWSKIDVFRTLWAEQGIKNESELENNVQTSFTIFRGLLEAYYQTQDVSPTEGTPEVFDFLRQRGIKVALSTGFYRKVTDIILERLNWTIGLDEQYLGDRKSIIDFSISSDQVQSGRPAPDMIQKAMQMLGVGDAKKVIKIGDTPVDLKAGQAAGCGYNFGITSGSHTEEQLRLYPNDGLFPSIPAFKDYLIQNALV